MGERRIVLAQIVRDRPSLCRQATGESEAEPVHRRRHTAGSGDGDVPAGRREDAVRFGELLGPIAGGMAARNGLSLARNDCSPSRTTAARSTLLAYLFDEILSFSSSPFDFKLPSSVALFTRLGMIVARSPLPSR
jgi:hypothetical protein